MLIPNGILKDTLKAFNDFKNKQKVYEVMFFDMQSTCILKVYSIHYIVIISYSTCCLVEPVKATWVCASFDSNLVIIIIIKTSTDPCGLNRSVEAASTAADDD